jgi:hypothetical protein
MTIEWFDPKIGVPIITIAEYGVTFNKAAIEAMGNPERVKLGFDKQYKKMCIMPVEDEDERAFAFADKERDGYVRINNKDFVRFVLRYFPELTLDKSIRCVAIWDAEKRLLFADVANIENE